MKKGQSFFDNANRVRFLRKQISIVKGSYLTNQFVK